MPQSTHKKTITPAEFAQFARENNVDVIYPSSYDPQPKGRAERQAQRAATTLLPIVMQYAAALEYLIRVDTSKGDTEGANLKRFTLATVNAAIENAGLSRDEKSRLINGVLDFDESAIQIADWLIDQFSGVNFLHLQALTERAVEIIGSRVMIARDTVIMPELPARRAPECPPSSDG